MADRVNYPRFWPEVFSKAPSNRYIWNIYAQTLHPPDLHAGYFHHYTGELFHAKEQMR